MSQVILSAVAWIPSEPTAKPAGDAPGEAEWAIYGEASVTDNEGNPITELPREDWTVHVTFSSQTYLETALTIAHLDDLPGFYLFDLEPVRTTAYWPPTACGIAVHHHVGERELPPEWQGQVVVPIALAWDQVIRSVLTP